MQNEVTVLFLSCTHQVVCFLSYVKKDRQLAHVVRVAVLESKTLSKSIADSNSKSKGNKTDDSEKPNIVQLSKDYVQHVKRHMIIDVVRRLDMENSQIMTDTQALKLSGSESYRDLQGSA
ncbi:hypothetical protein CASFOL_033745 [Castilleja foliolosa]|uniref:Uncharacterized protein n=1 Tax=Castilleja foliolosa TaxID=1961234 RepID=A0ABD3BYG1_9LAMI